MRSHHDRVKTAENYGRTIEEVFSTVSGANDILQLMLPDEKKKPMNDEVADIVKRMAIMKKIEEKLENLCEKTDEILEAVQECCDNGVPDEQGEKFDV